MGNEKPRVSINSILVKYESNIIKPLIKKMNKLSKPISIHKCNLRLLKLFSKHGNTNCEYHQQYKHKQFNYLLIDRPSAAYVSLTTGNHIVHADCLRY